MQKQSSNSDLKIISGGQTGIDRMGLEVAQQLGLLTGGTAPSGYWTENGPDLSLQNFGLVEHSQKDYPPRTRQNVLDSDATVLYGNTDSRGCLLTLQLCKSLNKSFILNPTPGELIEFIKKYKIRTLNVAGNRASKLTGQQLRYYRDSLYIALLRYSNI